MGDRANVAVVQHGGPAGEETGRVYLYTHYSGYKLPRVLRDVLASDEGRGRWTDEGYLARIIANAMSASGITSYLTDWNHPLIVVDTEASTVTVSAIDSHNTETPIASWSMAEYAALDFEGRNPWAVLHAEEEE